MPSLISEECTAGKAGKGIVSSAADPRAGHWVPRTRKQDGVEPESYT